MCELVLDYYMGLGVIKLSRRKKKGGMVTMGMYMSWGWSKLITKEKDYDWIGLRLLSWSRSNKSMSEGNKREVKNILSPVWSNYFYPWWKLQEERKSMIELVLAYYLVLGVIKLCLWGKRGVKIYLV